MIAGKREYKTEGSEGVLKSCVEHGPIVYIQTSCMLYIYTHKVLE